MDEEDIKEKKETNKKRETKNTVQYKQPHSQSSASGEIPVAKDRGSKPQNYRLTISLKTDHF